MVGLVDHAPARIFLTVVYSLIPLQRIIYEPLGTKDDLFSPAHVHIHCRFITSPRFVLKEPFNYNRENPEDYVRCYHILARKPLK